MFKRFFSIFLLIVFVLSSVSLAEAKSSKRRRGVGFTARSAMLWNITQNKIYFEKNSNMRVYPASTTKVMTVLLALEKLKLTDYVTVSSRVIGVQQTHLSFREGEEYRVADLVYACLLKSANDAAGVLAEAVGGSQSNFVEMMNARARSLGAVNTKFANAHGLPSNDDQYTTAKDMALILKEALKNDFFRKAISLKYRIIYSKTGRKHFLKSHNKALFLNWKIDIDGKTGYTRQAQSCFVGFFNKGDQVFIIDVFGCSKRWLDIKWLVEKKAKVDL